MEIRQDILEDRAKRTHKSVSEVLYELGIEELQRQDAEFREEVRKGWRDPITGDYTDEWLLYLMERDDEYRGY